MGEYIDKFKGKVNRVAGTLTGNDAKRVKGELQEQKGKLKGAFERGKAHVKDALEGDKL